MKQIEVTDENGETRQVWVAQIEADRDLRTIGTDGEEVVVANEGDHGGYVEVLCDENGAPIVNEDGTLPLPVPPGESGVDNGKGGLKGLSQNDMSWVHEGTALVGNASVRDDAQLIGPDAVVSGADQITQDVGVGGSHYRSSGSCTFEGNGSYVDMTVDPGAMHEFSGGTQIGGPVHFEAGAGKFQDDPETGRITMMFAAREGSELTVQTHGGFESNGLVALDDTTIGGTFQGNPDMVVQDSIVETDARFTGPVTVVNQMVGPETDGMEISGDADLDAVALTTEPKDGVSADYVTAGEFEDQADYLKHVSEVLTHELGENVSDTAVQHHYADVHQVMTDDLESQWRAIQEVNPDMSREEFDAMYRNLSTYHNGINDGFAEDMVQVRTAGGDTAVSAALDEYVGGDEELRAQILEGGDEAVQAYLAGQGVEADVARIRYDGEEAAIQAYEATAQGKAQLDTHERRAEAQNDGSYYQTSGAQWVHTDDPHTGGAVNQEAHDGLHDADWRAFRQTGPAEPVEPMSVDAGAQAKLAEAAKTPSKDWRISLANEGETKSEIQAEDDGPDFV